MSAHVLQNDDYWALRKPFDKHLPDSVPAEQVESELEVIHTRFRKLMLKCSQEDKDWEFPGHYQHVRVFYVYLYSRKLYTPTLAEIIRATLKGFESNWIGEFECYAMPKCHDRRSADMVYQNHRFVFHEDDPAETLIAALGLALENAE